jgi:Subtilase family
MTADRPSPYERLSTEPQRSDPRPEELASWAARTLDPATASRFQDQRLESTIYTGSRLLVRPVVALDRIVPHLEAAADEHGLDIRVDDLDEQLVEIARQAGIGPDELQPLIVRAELLPRWDSGPVSPPDAWPVLQSYRARFAVGTPERAAVQLEHLLTSNDPPDSGERDGIVGNPYWHVPSATGNPYWHVPGTGGNPYWHVPSSSGNPYWHVPGTGGQELASYAVPGFGGRTPVTWVGPAPARRPDDSLQDRRRPVVAVFDTGVGTHPWLPDGVVDREPRCAGLPIGMTDPATAPDTPGVSLNPLIGSLDVSAGHGTFIAGLIRQTCPDANILAVRVIQGDGKVNEADLLVALNMLWLRQKLAIIHGEPDKLVDVLSLSLGYYHEEPADAEFDPFLLAPLRALARLGVAIVTSAGNDATIKPMYPAAFAPYPGGLISTINAHEVPITAVGALNPDTTVALFSNTGPWVRALRPGVSLVSTLPPFDASGSPSVEVRRGGVIRATVDPDDFRSGFGLWSGTSFAAPILAGELAEYLNSRVDLPADQVDPNAALRRCWKGLRHLVEGLRRPGEPDPDAPDVPPAADENVPEPGWGDPRHGSEES